MEILSDPVPGHLFNMDIFQKSYPLIQNKLEETTGNVILARTFGRTIYWWNINYKERDKRVFIFLLWFCAEHNHVYAPAVFINVEGISRNDFFQLDQVPIQHLGREGQL